MALEVIMPFSKDQAAAVRAGVLEVLAEVMYVFREDQGGPPEELLRLFLGIREGETERRSVGGMNTGLHMTWDDLVNFTKTHGIGGMGNDSDIYDDPKRPLVCAFNYPAVALTLGRERWEELRGLYIELAGNEGLKVRRTLAASLGEMAKIVGRENARRDLMAVWWICVRSEEGEVRGKALEGLEVFLRAVGEREREEVVVGLVEGIWDGNLKGWREREGVMKSLKKVVLMEGIENDMLRRLVVKGLEDPVAAVREAAVSVVCFSLFFFYGLSPSL